MTSDFVKDFLTNAAVAVANEPETMRRVQHEIIEIEAFQRQWQDYYRGTHRIQARYLTDVRFLQYWNRCARVLEKILALNRDEDQNVALRNLRTMIGLCSPLPDVVVEAVNLGVLDAEGLASTRQRWRSVEGLADVLREAENRWNIDRTDLPETW